MPFYGRPSKNCQGCRERRIKCDRVEPVCSQCKRAGKSCGGYRDSSALLFRDENEKTARRSAAAKSKSEARRRLLDSLSEGPDKSSTRLHPLQSVVAPKREPVVILVPAIPATVPSSLEERGLQFFFSRFVTAVSGTQGSSHNLEPAPLLRTIPVEAPLQNAVIAVGLGALSNVTKDKSLSVIARAKYATAINVVRAAVENPKQANPAETFKIIVMLSLYEMISSTPGHFDTWTVHLDGVLALLKQASFGKALRGIEPRSQIQFYLISIARYFMAPGNISPEMLSWSPDVILSSEADLLPAIQLIDILIRFMKFHSSIHFQLDKSPESVVQSALRLDEEMEEWERSLPEKWMFIVKESGDLEHTFNGSYLVYNDIWASRDLNYYHWARLMLNEIVLVHLARSRHHTLAHLKQRQRALEMVTRMTTGICAGAASQMGVFGCGAPAKARARLPPLNGVFMLLFPLTIAGSAAGAPDEVQAWVIKTLEKIGWTMGIQRALQLIPKVEQDRARKRRKLDMN